MSLNMKYRPIIETNHCCYVFSPSLLFDYKIYNFRSDNALASVSCASVGGQLPGSRLRALAPTRHWSAPAPAQTQETPRSEMEKLHTSIDKYSLSVGKINDNYIDIPDEMSMRRCRYRKRNKATIYLMSNHYNANIINADRCVTRLEDSMTI